MSDERMAQNGPQKPAEAQAADSRPAHPAKIKLIYESVDGKLCLFEDEFGHLTAVRAAKLA